MTLVQPISPLGREVAAALHWWRDAGLEYDFSDKALHWLERPAPAVTEAPLPQPRPPVKAQPRPVIQFGGDRTGWPTNLSDFTGWWLTEPSLDDGHVSGRVPPRGPANAALMILVEYPESGDSDRLLSGPHGRLLESILAAWGLAADEAYVASALPRHMPMPDWQGLAGAGLAEIALHHVALVAPKRLISFGANVSSLLGHDPAKSAESLQQCYQVGPHVPALAAPGLETLMARPRGKARLWQALLDWQVP